MRFSEVDQVKPIPKKRAHGAQLTLVNIPSDGSVYIREDCMSENENAKCYKATKRGFDEEVVRRFQHSI